MPTLKWLQGRNVPWNGMMDTMAEGLEHGMRWIKHRFFHCNQLLPPHPELERESERGGGSKPQFVHNVLRDLVFCTHYLVSERTVSTQMEFTCVSYMFI